MYLIIDIGGTYIKYGYYQKSGNCIQKNQIPTIKTSKEDFYQWIQKMTIKDVEGIGISMPGLIDSDKGYIHAITLLPFFNQTAFCEELKAYSNLPVTIQNDAKCATLGEMWKGSLKNVDNGFMLVLGSGIGGTCLLNGKIFETKHHKAGEVGSFLVPQGYQFSNFGREYNAVKLIHELSEILNCPDDGKIVFQHLPESSKAMKHFQNYCQQLAMMIYNLDYLLDLDVVTIGGGISQQPLFIQTIQEQFHILRERYKEDNHEPVIKACQYQNEANLLGALYTHITKKED